jgi:hypothetical protein
MPTLDFRKSAAFFKRLEKAPLLAHAGEPLQQPDVPTLGSWKAVDKSMTANLWVNVRNAGGNYFTARLYAAFGKDWFNKHYNPSCDKIEQQRPAAIERIVRKCQKQNGLSDRFVRIVVGNLEWISFEYAASALLPEGGFFRQYVEQWYLCGHLPCGWKGPMPRDQKPMDPNLPKEQLRVPPLSDYIGNGIVVVF